MTYDEFKRTLRRDAITARKPPANEEHRIQSSCVRWFRCQYPQYAEVLFAIPNAARRSERMGAYMKEEGMLPGVSDLIFLKANRFYGALCIEMKKPKGKQVDTQKKWQQAAERAGNKYALCYSFEDFQREVNDYIAHIP